MSLLTKLPAEVGQNGRSLRAMDDQAQLGPRRSRRASHESRG